MIIQPEARDVALAVAHRFSRIQLQLRRSLCPSSFLLHSIPVCLVSVQPHLLQDSLSPFISNRSFIHSSHQLVHYIDLMSVQKQTACPIRTCAVFFLVAAELRLVLQILCRSRQRLKSNILKSPI